MAVAKTRFKLERIPKGEPSAMYWVGVFHSEIGGRPTTAAEMELEAAILDSATDKFLLKDESGRIVGAIAYAERPGHGLVIEHLGSLTKGGGTELMNKAIAAGKRKQVDVVLTSSIEARGFYEKLGFEKTGDVAYVLHYQEPLKKGAKPRKPLPTPVPNLTVNEAYRDAALRHQIGLRRYSNGVAKRVAMLLEKADAELTLKLRDRLARIGPGPIDFTAERWQALLEDMRVARSAALGDVSNVVRTDLTELAGIEAGKETKLLETAIPFEITLATVSITQLAAIVDSQPFQGKFLKDWFDGLAAADQAQLIQALQLGMAQGETIDEIVRRVIGTRAEGYADGILAITRRNAIAITRTAVNHVSNAARDQVWQGNDDIIQAKIWTSTLDGRTTAICRARDGHGTPIGGNDTLPPGVKPLEPPGVIPPAHVNCRSTMVAYIDGVGLVGKRPYVVDTRTRDKREVDFRKLARETGKPIQQVRKEWADRVIGRVPANTTYQDFLARQPAAFQDEVLGVTKGRLFRQGGLQLDQFVDRAGNELTLAELAASTPEAFIRAGLDPTLF